MALCQACGRDMLKTDGCESPEWLIQGVGYQRVRYGAEMRFGAPLDATTRTCHDCGASAGKLHHPGCDIEECPRCQSQAISCDCQWEGDRED